MFRKFCELETEVKGVFIMLTIIADCMSVKIGRLKLSLVTLRHAITKGLEALKISMAVWQIIWSDTEALSLKVIANISFESAELHLRGHVISSSQWSSLVIFEYLLKLPLMCRSPPPSVIGPSTCKQIKYIRFLPPPPPIPPLRNKPPSSSHWNEFDFLRLFEAYKSE